MQNRSTKNLVPQQIAIEMNADPIAEVFALNPYAANANPSSVEGVKLHMKASQ